MDPITFITLWAKIRPFHQLKLRREARKAAEAGATNLPSVGPDLSAHPPEHVETVINAAAGIVGAAKSKLIYLALAQLAYGLVQLWINNGTLTADSAEPLVTGFLTGLFRIFTGSTLAEKGSA